MNSKKVFSIYSLGVFALVMTAAVFAQVVATQGTEATYTFTGDALEGPETLTAGYHTFSLHNDGDKEADFVIIQLEGEGAAEDLVAEVEAVDTAFTEDGDPAAAFRTALEGRTLWGGPAASPQTGASVGVDLPAGQYVLLGSAYGNGPEAGPTRYFTNPLEVTGEGTAAPEADATVQMVDFAFALPADLQAGEQTWEVVNSGEQVHHMVIQKVKAGKTMEDVMTFAETFEGEDPTEEFAYVSMLSPGTSNYVSFDLEPGTYVAVCFIPDYAVGGDGAPHMAHGMMQSFTVGQP